jgi:acylphosphatase
MRLGRHVRIIGRVQGVFFRAWTSDEARALGINGWIRNCSDGTVEAKLEGEPDDLDRLIGLLHEGPPGARVDRVEVEDAEVEQLGTFKIRH